MKKDGHFECQQLEIGLEFVRWSFAKCNNFSEGSYDTKKYIQVIQAWGGGSSMSF